MEIAIFHVNDEFPLRNQYYKKLYTSLVRLLAYMKPHSPMTIIILKISIIFEAYYSVFFQWTQVLSVLQIYRYFVMIQFPLVKADYYQL